MKYLFIVLVAAAVIALRVWILPEPTEAPGRHRIRAARQPARRGGARGLGRARRPRRQPHLELVLPSRGSLGDVGMVARREITERVRGRIFRVGTLIILLAVGAAIIIPTLHHGGGPTTQTVGVVGALSPPGRAGRDDGRDTEPGLRQIRVRALPRQRPRPICARARSTSPSSTATRSCSTSPPARAAPRPIPASSRTWPTTSAC